MLLDQQEVGLGHALHRLHLLLAFGLFLLSLELLRRLVTHLSQFPEPRPDSTRLIGGSRFLFVLAARLVHVDNRLVDVIPFLLLLNSCRNKLTALRPLGPC